MYMLCVMNNYVSFNTYLFILQLTNLTVALQQGVNLTASFKNPLDLPLEQCSLFIDGPGIAIPEDLTVEYVFLVQLNFKWRLGVYKCITWLLAVHRILGMII